MYKYNIMDEIRCPKCKIHKKTIYFYSKNLNRVVKYCKDCRISIKERNQKLTDDKIKLFKMLEFQKNIEDCTLEII